MPNTPDNAGAYMAAVRAVETARRRVRIARHDPDIPVARAELESVRAMADLLRVELDGDAAS